LYLPPAKNLTANRGIVFDVSDWYIRHPGGVGMIKRHAEEDVTNSFDNFHGGWSDPLATLFGLQIGCTEYAS
jgi:cytochrome b involved in lipid metabolism